MERFTISLEPELARQFDEFIREKGYTNRSEAMRDLIREKLEGERLERDEGDCVATLGYIYDHHKSELANRVTAAQHAHHELTLSSMHVHLDHDNCLEVTILRGPVGRVRRFADEIIAQRGVRHGHLHMVPVVIEKDDHGHAHEDHVHSRPTT